MPLTQRRQIADSFGQAMSRSGRVTMKTGRYSGEGALSRMILSCLLALSLLATTPTLGWAQSGPTRGSVTNLPLPRFVSLKSDKANVRRGPSLSHRIDWVFVRRGYPLEVIAEYGHWRRVRDLEGATGWLHYSLISGVRTALVTDENIDLYSRPDPSSRLNAQAEKNVILRLQECNVSWCRVTAGGQKGWVLKSGIWGVRPDEILE